MKNPQCCDFLLLLNITDLQNFQRTFLNSLPILAQVGNKNSSGKEMAVVWKLLAS